MGIKDHSFIQQKIIHEVSKINQEFKFMDMKKRQD